jgi:DNA-binding transcriptional ArsR family regulator
MSIFALAWAKKQKAGSATRKFVLMAIADYADEHGKAYPSVARLAEDTELSDRSVQRALKDLEEAGLLRIEHPDGSNPYHANSYFLALSRAPVEADAPGATASPPGDSLTPPGVTVSPTPVSHRHPNYHIEPPYKVQTLSSASLQKESASARPDADDDCFHDPEPEPDPAGDPRKELFRRGLVELRQLTGRPEPRMRTLIASWLKRTQDDALTVLRVIDDAVEAEAIDPVAWIEARLPRLNGTGPPSSFRSAGKPYM